jgi:hypothetical protein
LLLRARASVCAVCARGGSEGGKIEAQQQAKLASKVALVAEIAALGK